MPDFGIGETLAAIGTFIGTTAPEAVGSALTTVGVGAETAGAIGSGVVDAGVGAGLGATEAAVTGGNIGKGALTGGITGGALGGLGPLVGDTLGIGATAGDALTGAAAGALGAGVTGGNPLLGAAEGGVSGLVTGSLSTPSGASAGGTTAPGPSAASIAPPGVTAPTDLTAGLGGIGGVATDPLAGVDTGAIYGNSGGSLPAAAAVKPSSIDTAISDPSAGNILKALGANAGPLVAGAGLAANLAGNNSNPTGLSELKSLAGGLETQGASLESYVGSGQLPPGAQAGLNQATKAAQAAIRSKYASMGLSGSTAETQDLSNVTLEAQAQQFQIADSLLKTGLDETNTSATLYNDLLQFDQKQSADTGAAIASLAAALSGGGTTIKLAA